MIKVSQGGLDLRRLRGNQGVGQVKELIRLTQLLVVEGAEIAAAFATLHGLHHTDVEALPQVMIAQDRGSLMSAGALAQELGLTAGAITAVVDRLERAGHLARVRDGADRRKVLLRYSPDGRALAEEFFVPLQRRSHAAMHQFTPAELEVARRYLTVTSAAMTSYRRFLAPSPHATQLRAGDPARGSGT